MAELEKVIRGLRDIDMFIAGRLEHEKAKNFLRTIDETIILLKEQEAIEPYQHDAVWVCGNCEKEVVGWDDDIDGKEYRFPFCRQCGQAVKWNEVD